MEKILSAQNTKKLDSYTIENCGLMGEVLMERAALAVADTISVKEVQGARILVVCGSGNNGADGICVARILQDRGFKVILSLIGNEDNATELYKKHKKIALNWGIEFYNIIPNEEYDVIVDAIFGIGLSREIEGKYFDAISRINSMKKHRNSTVYSVDIPSGISADNGQVLGIAVEADYTITFGYRKLGQLLSPGKEHCGLLIVKTIGFCGLDMAGIEPDAFTYTRDDLDDILPDRASNSHKGDYGKILIVAGTKNMAGAAILCAKAAIRSGAGLVKVFTTESNRIIVQESVPEALLCTYKEDWDNGQETIAEFKSMLIRELSWASMVIVGPGISTVNRSVKTLQYICKYATCPLLFDADALNIISENTNDLEENICIPQNTIITPHIKEMSRLTQKTVGEIKTDIIDVAKEYAIDKNVIVVLKDSKTVVTDGKKVYINSSGNEGLATGGSGDVLAGIIGSFAAQGESMLDAACAGVYVHGYAADIYSKEHRSFSLSPIQLIECLSDI